MVKFINEKKAVLLAALSAFIAVLMLGYSAYGWMTMSKSVTATIKDVTITAPTNLEISAESETTGFGTSAVIDLNEYVYNLINNSPDVKKFVKDSDTFSLMPASSYDGLELWTTNFANCNTGEARCGETGFDSVDLSEYGTGRIKFREDTDSFEGYFIDIPLWLRTASTSDIEIKLTDFSDITVGADNHGSATVANTVRCAFLNDDKTDISMPSTSNVINGYTYDSLIFASTGANIARGHVIKDTDSDLHSNYISPGKYLTKNNPDFSDATICTISAYTDDYHPTKINLRIWVEGEDTSCVANIGRGEFSIKLGFAA